MELQIRKASAADINEISELYDSLNDFLAANENFPGWKKGIYPIREDAERGLSENSLFVVISQGRIAGTFILRHEPEEAYYTAHWLKELPYEKIFVIYTLAVHPDFLHRGIGTEIIKFTESYAREHSVCSLRLDVYEKNAPAISLYEKNGFFYTDTVDLGYSKYGLDWYNLYEKIL